MGSGTQAVLDHVAKVAAQLRRRRLFGEGEAAPEEPADPAGSAAQPVEGEGGAQVSDEDMRGLEQLYGETLK